MRIDVQHRNRSENYSESKVGRVGTTRSGLHNKIVTSHASQPPVIIV